MFHCFTVSTDHKAKMHEGRYCVTAEYSNGYEILFRYHTMTEANSKLFQLQEIERSQT